MTAEFEPALAPHRAALARRAPQQLARFERLVERLQRGPRAMTADVRADLLELYRWQVAEQRYSFQRRLLTARRAANQGSALATRDVAALEKVLAALDAALTSSLTSQSIEPLLRATASARVALQSGVDTASASRRGAPATLAKASVRAMMIRG